MSNGPLGRTSAAPSPGEPRQNPGAAQPSGSLPQPGAAPRLSPPAAPGPRTRVLGTLIMPGRDPLAMFTRFAAEYGDVVHFRMAGEHVYFINHPQLVRDVLVTNQRNFTKSRGLERAKKLLGEGLLTSEGHAHLRQRRLLQPAFHRERIAAYGAVMVDRAARMRTAWQPGATLDVAKEMMRLTLSIVGKTLFDSDVDSKADEVGVAVTDVLETFWLNLLPGADLIDRLPVGPLRRARAARERLDALIYSMIKERRASGRDHGDLLSMLIAAQDEEEMADGGAPGASRVARGMSDRQIRDEAMTLLLAGHETTANALTWTWYLLSQHPAVAARLHAEIDDVLHGRLPAVADLSKLPFTDRVVTESMRLYPPAWVIGRRAIDEFALGEYTVPARSIVFMSPYVLHRDARFYPDPLAFRPDRWTPEFRSALPPFAYVPFGGGARKCIGDQFALMELALVLTTVAQHWELQLAPGHPVVPQPLVTLRAKHGMRMELRRRT
jgi:cytochrome P450